MYENMEMPSIIDGFIFTLKMIPAILGILLALALVIAGIPLLIDLAIWIYKKIFSTKLVSDD